MASWMRKRFAIGLSAGAAVASAAWWYSQSHDRSSRLNTDHSVPFRLESVTPLNATTSRFRFALRSPDDVLGLPVASYVIASDNAMVWRPYTPVTLDAEDRGHFDLLVKKYERGYFSNYIHSLKPGDTLDFSGPVVKVKYEPNVAQCLGMIAGGTGITPMYQIIRTVLRNAEDRTRIVLVYGNRSVDEILLRSELDALAAAHPDRFKVCYVVEESPQKWEGEVGRVTGPVLQRKLPPPTEEGLALLVCGPTGMMLNLCGSEDHDKNPKPLAGVLRQLGYANEQVIRF